MIQQTIDFDAPIARATDPETSRAAAASLERGTAQYVALEAAKQLCTAGQDATANEIGIKGAEIGGPFMSETIRKRVKELVKKGWLKQSGARRCLVTGKTCTAYILTKQEQ